MPSLTNTSDEIAALLAGYARRCEDCDNVILANGDMCSICLVLRLQEQLSGLHSEMQELRKRVAKQTWPKWPKNAKTYWQDTSTTLTKGDTT